MNLQTTPHFACRLEERGQRAHVGGSLHEEGDDGG